MTATPFNRQKNKQAQKIWKNWSEASWLVILANEEEEVGREEGKEEKENGGGEGEEGIGEK